MTVWERKVRQECRDPGPEPGVEFVAAEPLQRNQVPGGGGGYAAQQLGVGVGSRVEQHVGGRAESDPATVGGQRESADQQGGDVEFVVAGSGRVHDPGHVWGQHGCPAGRVERHCPGQRPVAAFAFFDGPVGEVCLGELSGPGHRGPAGDVVPRGIAAADGDRAVGLPGGAERTDVAVRVDGDFGEPWEGQQQRLAGLRELQGQTGASVRVAELQDDCAVETVGRAGAVGERQPQQRHPVVAAGQFFREFRVGPARGDELVVDEGGGPVAVPPHCPVPGRKYHVVAERGDRGEADPEAAHRSGVAFRGGTQRGQGLHAFGGERGTGVRGGELSAAEPQNEASPPAGALGGVRGVLRQFHDDTVAVAAEGVVVFSVGVFPEARGGSSPAVEDPRAQVGDAERVGHSVRHPRNTPRRS